MKKLIFILLLLFTVFGLNKISATDEWTETDTTFSGYYKTGSLKVYYGFGQDGPLKNGTQSFANVYASRPTVFLEDLRTNATINHIWALGNGTSSSNLLFAFPSEEAGARDGYKIYSDLGKAEKIFTKGSLATEDLAIRVDSTVDVENYAKLAVSVILTPIQKESIRHEHVVTNTGDQPARFMFLKSVDTELAGNDHIPVKNIGDDKGLYIETGDYRLEYIFNQENAPISYRNW